MESSLNIVLNGSPKTKRGKNLLQSNSVTNIQPGKQNLAQTLNPQTTRQNKKINFQASDLYGSAMFPQTVKNNLPSRFDVLNRVEHITYNQKEVLGNIQSEVNTVEKRIQNLEDLQNSEDIKRVQPKQFRIKQPSETKHKPLKREEFDLQNFKEIFVQPKEKILTGLKNKEEKYMPAISAEQKYEKTIDIYNKEGELKNKPQVTESDKNLARNFSNIGQNSLKQDILIKQGDFSGQSVLQLQQKEIQQHLNVLESMNMESPQNQEMYFFDQMIQVQPPDLPNASIASPLTPGNGYAPSIPLTYELNDKKANIKDLLVRAKAGMQAGDVQKEAHLAYYLGMVYEQQKHYSDSIKYYKKYYTCAKMMEDKIGLALAANRIAINLFYNKDVDKSIDFHKINLQLSDIENTFAAYYNLGICYRKVGELNQANTYFAKALEWAKTREELESECISYGQMGVTYQLMKAYDESLDQFTECHDLARKLRNNKLQLDCLMNITKITSSTNLRSSDNAVRDAIKFAKSLEDQKTSSICFCNLGVIEGEIQFRQDTLQMQFEPEMMDEEDYLKKEKEYQEKKVQEKEVETRKYEERRKTFLQQYSMMENE